MSRWRSAFWASSSRCFVAAPIAHTGVSQRESEKGVAAYLRTAQRAISWESVNSHNLGDLAWPSGFCLANTCPIVVCIPSPNPTIPRPASGKARFTRPSSAAGGPPAAAVSAALIARRAPTSAKGLHGLCGGQELSAPVFLRLPRDLGPCDLDWWGGDRPRGRAISDSVERAHPRHTSLDDMLTELLDLRCHLSVHLGELGALVSSFRVKICEICTVKRHLPETAATTTSGFDALVVST